ncbi:cell wall metabolism sensor histidine kinase WalK [Microbacterium sp. Marseille-Q6965]|uniref:sensor histidine kinase n=1 Tax=Microbacterium sp. Marseille-Q6965 TaxID=2965072 RepID=UPI0021B70D8A|nr:HAMP domain-containing sensor histidine kinase [Microbacterium sp. Marseille-Q6965]
MTVAVLAIGLFVAGVGTSFVLYSALLSSVDESAVQLVQSDTMAERVLDAAESSEDLGDLRTEYFVALYGPDGRFIASAGGLSDEAVPPRFPSTLTLDEAQPLTSEVFGLKGADGSEFRASVGIVEPAGKNAFYSQIIALPHAEVISVVRTYFAVFTFVALMTIVAGAFGTRWLVTLTFRRFRQVESTAMAIAGGDFHQRMTDIEPTTEIGRLKSAINTMLDRVDASISQRDATVRQMRRFIGDASHELRTPLVSVRGYAELYRMGAIQTPEDTARAMERIEKEATRMGVLVEDLLALARLDERRELDIAPIDLRRVARDLALDTRAADPSRPVTVIDRTLVALTGPIPTARETSEDGDPAPGPERRRHPATSAIERVTAATLDRLRRRRAAAETGDDVAPIDFSEPRARAVAIPPLVLGEENKVRQVVTNLLGNARRYSPEGTPIELEVGVDPDADMGWIAVVDHGEGVPEAIREQIFERFWRADTSRARETGGSGLGLAIVASIVEAHHGSVAVEDTPGGGATFKVAFPLAERREAAEHAAIETQPLPRLRDEPPREA